MDKIKDKWQFIVGFAAVLISLSAYKDELSEVTIDFNYYSLSLSHFFLGLIGSLIIIMYFYAIPYLFSTTKYSNLKIFYYIERLVHFLLIITILSPFLLLSSYLILQVISLLNININSVYILLAVSFLSVILTLILNKRYLSYKRQKEKEKALKKEVSSYEKVDKLIKEGYYNQSLFESYKIVEFGIFNLLKEKGLIYRMTPFSEIMRIAKKYNVFSKDEMEKINKIQSQRNLFTHDSTLLLTREDAQNAQSLAKEILLKIKSIEKNESESTTDYFKGEVFNDLDKAKKISKKKNKPLFIIIYDKNHPTKSKLNHSLGYFMEYEATKKLVNKNFIQVLIDSDKPNIHKLIPTENPLENCFLVIMDPDGKILKQEDVYANSSEGLKRTKKLIEKWEKEKASS